MVCIVATAEFSMGVENDPTKELMDWFRTAKDTPVVCAINPWELAICRPSAVNYLDKTKYGTLLYCCSAAADKDAGIRPVRLVTKGIMSVEISAPYVAMFEAVVSEANKALVQFCQTPLATWLFQFSSLEKHTWAIADHPGASG